MFWINKEYIDNRNSLIGKHLPSNLIQSNPYSIRYTPIKEIEEIRKEHFIVQVHTVQKSRESGRKNKRTDLAKLEVFTILEF